MLKIILLKLAFA